MKAYSINPDIQDIQEIDIEIQANTVYSFLNSILVDEISIVDKHTLYSDADAIAQNKKPFFVGELLIVGKTLVLGKEGFTDIQANIPIDDLISLVNFEVPVFYEKALSILSVSDINLYRIFVVSGKDLNITWILQAYSVADENTQNVFLNKLEETVKEKKDVLVYLQTMAGFAIKAIG